MPGLLSSQAKLPFARRLRKEASDAESRMWYFLRDRRLGGFKFRRQFSIGPYIADFCCYELRLIIELDGGQHKSRRAYDENRTTYLKQEGFRVVRFWNNTVIKETNSVRQAILAMLQKISKQSIEQRTWGKQ